MHLSNSIVILPICLSIPCMAAYRWTGFFWIFCDEFHVRSQLYITSPFQESSRNERTLCYFQHLLVPCKVASEIDPGLNHRSCKAVFGRDKAVAKHTLKIMKASTARKFSCLQFSVGWHGACSPGTESIPWCCAVCHKIIFCVVVIMYPLLHPA